MSDTDQGQTLMAKAPLFSPSQLADMSRLTLESSGIDSSGGRKISRGVCGFMITVSASNQLYGRVSSIHKTMSELKFRALTITIAIVRSRASLALRQELRGCMQACSKLPGAAAGDLPRKCHPGAQL